MKMSKLIYHQTEYPIFQNRMYESREEARNCPKGEISLGIDPKTGVICNLTFRPELMLYDNHYQNEQGLSQAFQQHLDEVSNIVARLLGKNQLVEIGCGKGFFLEKLVQKGFEINGFDPAYEGNNPRIQRVPFSSDVLNAAQGLILRHVLEHIQNPLEFLQQIADANGNTGHIYIEVPCFDWICQKRAWFDIFYEHVNYFRLSDFNRWLGTIYESGHLFGGQYLYVVADLGSLKNNSKSIQQDRILFPQDFLSAINTIQESKTKKVIWGGASKGVIFALLMERAGQPVDIVIDINPAKQGKYIAATGLEVLSPDAALPELSPGSSIYVMNSNYLEEIRTMTKNAYTYIGVEYD